MANACAAVSFFPMPVQAGDALESLIKKGNFFGEARYRYEFVDQDGPAIFKDTGDIKFIASFRFADVHNGVAGQQTAAFFFHKGDQSIDETAKTAVQIPQFFGTGVFFS